MRTILVVALTAFACGSQPVAPVRPQPAEPPAPAQGPELVDDAELSAKVDPIVAELLGAAPAASISVAVARAGEVVFAKGYGQADREHDRAATARTAYRIGSVTKQFTAALVVQLVAEGKLGLDDPVTAHLPDFPIKDERITVRRLLQHTSGLYNYTDDDFVKTAAQERSLSDLIAYFGKHPLQFEPGTQWSYSNSNYIALGAILEKLTGKAYAELVASRLSLPLELGSLAYCPNQPVAPDDARGYKVEDDALAPSDPIDMTGPHAAGALCATAIDLVRWTVALHAGRVVRLDDLAQMLAPAPLVDGSVFPYGFGLALGDLEGHAIVSHDGGINGFMSSLAYYPADELAIAVVANTETSAASQAQTRIARAVLELGAVEVKDLPLTAEEAAAYLGTYTFAAAPGLTFEVTYEDGKLVARAGGAAVSLLNQGDGVFLAPKVEAKLTFRDGRLTVNQGGMSIEGQKAASE